MTIATRTRAPATTAVIVPPGVLPVPSGVESTVKTGRKPVQHMYIMVIKFNNQYKFTVGHMASPHVYTIVSFPRKAHLRQRKVNRSRIFTRAQRSSILVGSVGAVVDTITQEVGVHAEFSLLAPEVLAPVLWNSG